MRVHRLRRRRVSVTVKLRLPVRPSIDAQLEYVGAAVVPRRIEREAAANKRFHDLLGGVWYYRASDELKARLDALTDGIFAVAMTILILDVRLPDDFHPADTNALLRAIRDLWPKFVPYLISFFVLGNNWLASIQLKSGEEFVSRSYAARSLLYLVLATCLPFSTTVLGRFGNLAPADGL